MAEAVGIGLVKHKLMAFAAGAAMAGLAGAIFATKLGSVYPHSMKLEVSIWVLCLIIVGGMGSIPGAFLAAVIIGELSAFGILVLPESTLVMMFVVMAVVLIVRPYGLLGKPGGQEQGTVSTTETPLRGASGRLKLIALGLLLIIILMPLFVVSFHLVLLIEIAIITFASMSLYYIIGPGGMHSFGHAAFFGGGAYVSALLVHHLGSTMEIALFFAPIGTGLLALIIGWLCVRLSGVYLAMLTLAFAQICWSIV